MKKAWPFYLITCSIFLLLISPKQWADGMFLDGMIYAAIARNMAIDLGSIWKPYYTALATQFYDHPPLAFWLESLLFRIAGDSIYVERTYSFFTFVITGGIMLLIWRRITGSLQNGWVPLLFWIIIPTVFWACSNNMLENTMMVFTTLSVYFYQKKEDNIIFLILSALCIFLAFLSKGIFSLFVLSVPFWLWLFRLEPKPSKWVVSSILLTLFTVAPLFLIFVLEPDFATYLKSYWFNHVIHRVHHDQVVNYRAKIVVKMISDLLPPLIICIVLMITGWKMKMTGIKGLQQYQSRALALLCIALSGVLPIMISLKQSSFYMLASFPFFSLALAVYILPIIEKLRERMQPQGYWALARISVVLLLTSLCVSFTLSGRTGRDHMQMNDLYATLKIIPRNSVISIPKHMHDQWQIYALYSRYGQITADPYHLHDYYLTWKDSQDVPEGYSKISLKTFVYDLHKSARHIDKLKQ